MVIGNVGRASSPPPRCKIINQSINQSML